MNSINGIVTLTMFKITFLIVPLLGITMEET